MSRPCALGGIALTPSIIETHKNFKVLKVCNLLWFLTLFRNLYIFAETNEELKSADKSGVFM